MLSDVGSRVIRAFGIFNTNIPPDHKMLYGIPFPGDFLIAPDGTVRDKVFLPNYEHRATASSIVARNFGVDASSNSVPFDTGVLSGTIGLSSDRCFPGQELGLALRLRIAPEWHIYGKPLPAHYQALEVTLKSPLIDQQTLDLPPARPLELKALGETLPVYAGVLEVQGKAHVRWSPPMPARFLLAIADQIEPGLHQVEGEIRFQACSEQVCEPPQTIPFKLPLTIEAGIPPAPKQA